jgi:hypothetical protein
VRGILKVTARDGTRILDQDHTAGPARGAHHGADQMMCADIAKYLRSMARSLPVSILDAMEAGIASIALDEERKTRQIIDLKQFLARLGAFGLRK